MSQIDATDFSEEARTKIIAISKRLNCSFDEAVEHCYEAFFRVPKRDYRAQLDAEREVKVSS